MLPQWIQRVQMEETFSWLSTLGGAYSSLGDNIYNCVSSHSLWVALPPLLGKGYNFSHCVGYSVWVEPALLKRHSYPMQLNVRWEFE